MRNIKLMVLLSFVFCSCVSAFDVTFVSISKEDEEFWGRIIKAAKATAKDLDINLKVLYADRSQIKAVNFIKEIVKQEKKPDYLILVGEKRVGGNSIKLAEKAKIKSVLYGDLSDNEKIIIGTPREKYKYWLGQRKINDFLAGYLVAKTVIDKVYAHNNLKKTDKVNIFGLAGVFQTSFNQDRVKGLSKALAEYPNVKFLQMAPASWMENRANAMTKNLLERYERKKIKVSGIWSANTQMALGAIKAMKSRGLVPGKDIFVSGVDFMPEGIKKVADGELESIVGGHFLAISWLLVMLYDYEHGIDFVDDCEIPDPVVLTKENAQLYLKYFLDDNWDQVDFRKFSKHLNPSIKKYKLDFNEIIKQIKENEIKCNLY